jgi:SHS2 domain-containing protein
MEKFKFFEHTADVEFEAYGKTLEEAFENAALAMFSVMTDTIKVKPKTKKEFEI